MSQPGEEDSDGDGRGDENLPRAAWVEKGLESDTSLQLHSYLQGSLCSVLVPCFPE